MKIDKTRVRSDDNLPFYRLRKSKNWNFLKLKVRAGNLAEAGMSRSMDIVAVLLNNSSAFDQ